MTTASDDRVALSDLLFGFALAIDTRDWVAYRNVFTDRIDLDYSSYRPGSAGPISADAWVDRARRLFPGLAGSQHSISNVRIAFEPTGDRATLTSYVRADHYLPNDQGDSLWTLGGIYTHAAVRTDDGWRFDGVTLRMLWNHGNRHVMTLGAERAALAAPETS